MAKIVYVLTNGIASNLRYVDDAYALAAGEQFYTGASTLPDISTLNTAAGAAAIAHRALQGAAQIALDQTDLVALRCLKASVAFPAAWQTYTVALRAIVNGTDTTSTALPTQPAFPVGT